uniref:Uncharacterized protein LOC111121584 n=1 Tax=Crassostrea virginica TaxID=6565 RepID=A0A8B8CVY5_CRAVI|nr:uncharacterized protein LOC111121584 [Crassostrea virginica]
MDIIREMEAEAEKTVDQESEWKTRYNYQTLYNTSLRKQVKKMRGEARLLRNGVTLSQVSADMDRMSTAGCRQHVKHLKTELLSLRGLCTSYDHKLDEESAEYIRAQEEILSIVNDVRFKQAMRIEEQEKRDSSLPPINARPPLDNLPTTRARANNLPATRPRVNLPSARPIVNDLLTTRPQGHKMSLHQEKLPNIKPHPLQQKSSYLQMYEKTKARKQPKSLPKSAVKRVHFSFDAL